VVELEPVLTGERRTFRVDEPAARERDQCGTDGGLLVGRRDRLDRRAPEVPADDRCAFEHRSLRGRQAVDPRRDRDLECRRQRIEQILGGESDELLEEQRVPLGLLDRRLDDTHRQAFPLRQQLEECSRLVVGDRAEHERVVPPRGPRFEKLGPRDTDEQQRTVRPAEQIFDEVEEVGSSPVHVLEEHDEWPIGR
jgi:hypothetical protein